MTGRCCRARAVQSFEPMTVPGQAQPFARGLPDGDSWSVFARIPAVPRSTGARALRCQLLPGARAASDRPECSKADERGAGTLYRVDACPDQRGFD